MAEQEIVLPGEFLPMLPQYSSLFWYKHFCLGNSTELCHPSG